MSRSNYTKPFYVDVGTSIVAVRCASNHDVVLEYDHSWHPFVIELAEKACDRMNKEVESRNSGDCAKLREAVIGLRDRISIFYKSEWIPYDEWEGANDDADAALAAPPRNCDRPECATTTAAQDVWRREDGGKTAYYEWLLATATEKKGESNEHK